MVEGARAEDHRPMQTAGVYDMRVLCAVRSGAKNALRRRSGFSPEQWVCGKSSRMPADFVDCAHKQASHKAAEETRPFPSVSF